jgi:hypothetical protein
MFWVGEEYGSGRPRFSIVIPAAVFIIGGIIGGCGACTINWKNSEGDRVGMINKTSRKGPVWETYEGQMALEGIASGGGSVGANVWDFSIDNSWDRKKQDELADKLRSAMDSGQKVKAHYIEMVKTWPWRSGSSHLIQSIEPVSASGLERRAEVPYESLGQKKTDLGYEVNLDGRHYLLKHDNSGKLKITELKEVQ